ncbi:ferritin family protein [Geobacter benzoatilyticus]|uniref:Ferritin family protein n=1 Tax=Geobacter benzoatilyticus TaxID=2815309 RepID=A0ABX7Q5U9_9BACT|nr:ferritin family protein [Geobacter benzoatilyticus]QSV46491.1 ferritin family protein [Geobacter benzoatilyticus]
MEFKTLDDIIKFAVQREENAYQLYKTAAQKATSISARKMFEEMAEEEAGHKVAFEKLDMGGAEKYTIADRPDMKIAEYMTELPFREDMSYPEILRYAMKTEENAYKLYTAASELTDDPKFKRMLLVLADIEKGHKLKIEAVYDERVLTEM